MKGQQAGEAENVIRFFFWVTSSSFGKYKYDFDWVSYGIVVVGFGAGTTATSSTVTATSSTTTAATTAAATTTAAISIVGVGADVGVYGSSFKTRWIRVLERESS